MSNAYPWLFSLGALAGLLWLGWVNPGSKKSQTSVPVITRIDAGLSALVLGLIGARLGYALMHIQFYVQNPAEILKTWNGGLTWAGGAVGAIIALSLYAAISRCPFWRVADTLAMPATLFAFSLWFGCMLDGCAYGKPSLYGFLTPASQDIFGTRANRWPTQAAGAILSLGTLAILDRIRFRKPAEGVIASTGILLISAINFLLAFLRGDSVPVLYGLRSDALASAAFSIFATLALIHCIHRGKRSKNIETRSLEVNKK